MEICSVNKCSGCATCQYICTHKAIRFEEDEIGHQYPVIDERLCVKCKQCINKCPSANPVSTVVPQKVYASWSNNVVERKTSTSGGISAELCKRIISGGGVVYGCSGEGKRIRHIRINKITDLWKIKGSKYVQSYLDETFDHIKEDLINGITCLFIGTPCQVAAIRNLFGKYENLITIDLVCHGVMPQRLLYDHLKSQSIIVSGGDYISFRNERGYYLEVSKDNHKLFSKEMYSDEWYTLYNERIGIRPSCGECDYSSNYRVGDITLGDFWGYPDKKQTATGVSLVLINNRKGDYVYNSLLEGGLVYAETRKLDEATASNISLKMATPISKKSEKFKRIYVKSGIQKAYKKTTRIRQIKNSILKIRRLIK